MSVIETSKQFPANGQLLREEMLYYRLSRIKHSFLQGLEEIDGMLVSVKADSARRLDTHQALCLATSSVEQSLQAIGLVSEKSAETLAAAEASRNESCGFCADNCQYARTLDQGARP